MKQNPDTRVPQEKAIRVWTGKMSQAGAAAPTVDKIYQNTLGEIVWTRQEAGLYIGAVTPKEQIDSDNVVVYKLTSIEDISGGYSQLNEIYVDTSVNGVSTDGQLNGTVIEIRVYNK